MTGVGGGPGEVREKEGGERGRREREERGERKGGERGKGEREGGGRKKIII